MQRRTEVPNDELFFFSEQDYIAKLKTYESNCAEFDACVGNPKQIQAACDVLRVRLRLMFGNMRYTDSIRYDFIQHYLAYHRSKLYELDCEPEQTIPNPDENEQEQTIPEADENEPYAIRYHHICRRKVFHREQARLLQLVLVHRAGHRPHRYSSLDTYGQQYYNAVDGCVASVYEADRADREAFAVHGPRASGFSAKLYVGDVRMTADGLSIFNGEHMPWTKVDHTGMHLDS